jgi:outer membrane protein OmpA-like peptidoglycan-associated protein
LNSKPWTHRCASIAIASAPLVTALMLAGTVRAEDYEAEFQAGQNRVSTQKAQEIDKHGYALGASVRQSWAMPYGSLGLGLGAFMSKLDGRASSRGITQDLNVKLFTIDLRYLYAFTQDISFGPMVQAGLGRGAKFGVQGNDDVDLLIAPGVLVRYAWKDFDYQPAVSLSYTHDANIAKREIETILLGLSFNLDLGMKTSDTASMPPPKSPVASTAAALPPAPVNPVETPALPPAPVNPVETPALPPAPVNPVETPSMPPAVPSAAGAASAPSEVKPRSEPSSSSSPSADGPVSPLEKIIFYFSPNSSRLNGISRERAKALAKVLIENAEAWTMIRVTGHSDKSGEPALNKELSKRRTEAFCDTLAKRGVPRKKMVCVPMDSQQLLPDLPENAENHRRIEVSFEEFDRDQAERLKQDIQKNLQL